MLKKLRTKIDAIDLKILRLLEERIEIVKQIGKLKTKNKISTYSPEREREIISKLKRQSKLSGEVIENIFGEIIHASRAFQRELKVAYLGPVGSFTHQAAIKKFGRYAKYVPFDSLPEIFHEAEKERVDYGVVPIENSNEGVINHTLDMFMESALLVSGEVNLPIHHYLLADPEATKIKKIFSHPQAFAQCRNYIEKNYPRVKLIEVSSTSEAAKMAKRDKNSAAIASLLAKDIYGLKILAERIEDIKENYTRFLIIGKYMLDKSGNDKTSLLCSIKDRIGALYDLLKPFKDNGINLTSIESRPTKKRAWEYAFFIDFIGHVQDKNVKRALRRLEKICTFVKILGSYPRAE